MVWNIVFSYINNEITGIGYGGIESSVIISCVFVKKVKVAVVRAVQMLAPRSRETPQKRMRVKFRNT